MTRYLLVLLLAPLALRAATYYCGPTSTGAGTGADFNNLLALPNTTGFSRGNTYVFIEGSYGSRTFQTTVSGSTLITVRKATSAESAVAGYASTLHDGTANFANLTFLSSYWVFSGETRSGWTSGYGVVCSTGSGIQMGQNFTLDVSHITVKYVQLIGTSSCAKDRLVQSIGNHQYITLSHCHLSDAGESVIHAYGTDHMTIEHCYLARNSGDVCNGSQIHSEIIVVSGNNDLTIRYNWIDEPASTAPIATPVAGHPGCAGDQLDVWYIYGNVFTGPGTSGSGMIYIFDCTVGTVYFVNNTIAGLANSSVVTSTSSSGAGCCGTMIARNNLYVDGCERGVGGNITSLTLTHNGYWSSPGAVGGSSTYVATGSPLVNWQNGNFSLLDSASAAMDGGTAVSLSGHSFDLDLFGNQRGADGKWDRGAVEYGGTPPEAVTPNITSGNQSWTNGIAGQYIITVDNYGGANVFAAAPLPTGLSVSAITGVISGTPTGYSDQTNITVTLAATNTSLHASTNWDTKDVTFTIYAEQPVLWLSMSQMDFSFIPTNTYRELTLTISNAGASGTTLSGVVSNLSAGYALETSPATFSLSVASTKDLTVRYTATSVGTNIGVGAVAGNWGSNYVNLYGAGYPIFSSTNWPIAAALLSAPAVSNENNWVRTTVQDQGAAIWGYNQAAQTTGTIWGTLIATNLSASGSLEVDAVSSEHVENAASGETTTHAQGNLVNGYALGFVGSWDATDGRVTGLDYGGQGMQLLAEHNLNYYGEYRVAIFGLPLGDVAADTVTVTMTSDQALGHYNIGVITLQHVDQSDSYGTAVDGVGTNTTASLTVGSDDNESVFMAVIRGNRQGSPNSGETEHLDTQPEANGESTYPDTLWVGSEPGAASVDIAVDFTASDTYCATAILIRATTNAGTDSFYLELNLSTNLWPVIPKVTNGVSYVHAVGTGTLTAPQYYTNSFELDVTNLFILYFQETNTLIQDLNFVSDVEVGADTTDPVVTITSPTETTQSESTVNLAGTASDNVGVVSMTATNTTTGVGYTVDGLTTWTVDNITLQSGANTIVVYALDAEANEGTDSIEITYTPPVSATPSKVNDLRVNNLYTP